MDLSNYKEMLEAVGKYLPETTKELDSLGSTIVGAVNSIASPLYFINEGVKFFKGEFKEYLENKKKDIPKEKQCDVPKYIAYPVVERLKYSFDEEYLKNMYMNLLSSSMNKDNLPSIHPSFYSIIESLSHLDAEIFKYIFNEKQSFVSATMYVKIKDSNLVYYRAFPKYFIIQLLDNIKSDPFLISSSISNLYRLGLINIKLAVIDEYEKIKFTRHIFSINTLNNYKNTYKNVILDNGDYYYIQVSDFGHIFGKICISDS